MATNSQCPENNLLQALLDGDLSEEGQTSLESHLKTCETCRARLDELTGQVGLLSDSGRREVSEGNGPNTALRGAMSRLKAAGPGSAADSSEMPTVAEQSGVEGISLDFLDPPSQPHCLGRLGEYEITGVVGHGGMGVVLKGRDPALNRYVAIKVLSPQLASSAVAGNRFMREAQMAAAVSHDHVVTIHAVAKAKGLPFLVMEYVAGVSLEERIRRTGPLKVEEILRIGMQAASGLAAAHAQGLVHRDIKPSNILLENGVERVKITDFGLARVVHEAKVTQTGVVAGTPEYMSPEQARGEEIDRRSDLFSLGCVLYAMCTGRSPFRATTVAGAIHRVCEDTPRAIRETNPDIPEWLTGIIDRLLAKKPEDRHQTAGELAEVLGKSLAHVQQSSKVEMQEVVPLARKPRQHDSGPPRLRTVVVSVGACLCFVLAVTGLWYYIKTPTAPERPSPIVPGAGIEPSEPGIPEGADQQELLRLSSLEQLAGVHVQKKLFTEAKKVYDELLQLRTAKLGEEHRDTLRTRFLIAGMLKAQARTEEAAALYQAVLTDQNKYLGHRDIDTQNTASTYSNFCVYQAWARICSQGKSATDYAEGLRFIERALETSPSGDQLRFTLALALYRNGDLNASGKAIRQSAQFENVWPGLCLLSAVVCSKQGNPSLARDWYLAGCDWIVQTNDPGKSLLAFKEEARDLLGMPATPNDFLPAVYDTLLRESPRGSLTAEIHRRRGELDAAEADLTSALQVHPDFLHLRIARGDLRIALARWQDAEADYTKIVELAPRDIWKRYLLARLQLFVGNETAYRDLRRETLVRWRDTTDGIAALQAALSSSLLPLADDDLRTTLALAQRACEQNPKHGPRLLTKGMALYRAGDYVGTLNTLADAMARNGGGYIPLDALSHTVCAMAHAQQRHDDDAAMSMLRARSLICVQGPSVSRAQFRGGWYDWLATFIVFEEALQVVEAKESSQAKAELQSLLQPGSDGLARATDCLAKLLAESPSDFELIRQHADALARQGRWSEAAEGYSRLVTRYPSDAGLWSRLAPLLCETNVSDYPEHCADMRERFNNPADWSNHGLAIQASLWNAKADMDWTKLSRSAEDNVKKAGRSAVAGHRRAAAGLACYRAGRYEDALPYLEWAKNTIDHKAESVKALFPLAVVYQRLGRADDARKCLELGNHAVRLAFPTAETGDFSPGWADWLICDILRREAETCLGTGSQEAKTP